MDYVVGNDTSYNLKVQVDFTKDLFSGSIGKP